MDESVPVHLVDESVPFSFPLIIGLIVVLLTFLGGRGVYGEYGFSTMGVGVILGIVTRDNIVWKLAHGYCVCYC